MDPLTIAALAEQGITLAIQIYQQIEASANAAGTPVKPLSEILGTADANFAQVLAASKQ